MHLSSKSMVLKHLKTPSHEHIAFAHRHFVLLIPALFLPAACGNKL